MKITSVDIYQLHQRGDPMPRPVVCKVNTDEGIYGYGEAGVCYGKGSPASAWMIHELADLIIGMDPLEHEVIWNKLHKGTFWGQNGGPVVFAGISAIDIALWDIKGKFFNVPIYKLLGGKMRDKLRTYASQLQFGWGTEYSPGTPQYTPDDYKLQGQKAVADGYDCVKVDVFTYKPDGSGAYDFTDTTGMISPKMLGILEDRIAAVREGIGPDCDFIIENHSTPDAETAIQIAHMAEKYNIFYFEEPNTPSPYSAKYIASKINIPIASGERIYTRWQYIPYFMDHSLAVIQPDPANCGGITETKKICDMAHAFDVGVQPHVCSSPILTAAGLQLEAAIPNFVIHEQHIAALDPSNRELGLYDYQPVNGYFEVPELPGIGNELSEYAIETADIMTVK